MSKLSRRGFVALSGATLFAAMNRPRRASATQLDGTGMVSARLEMRNESDSLLIDVYLTNQTDESILFDRSGYATEMRLQTDSASTDLPFSVYRAPTDEIRPMPRVMRPDYATLVAAVETHLVCLQPSFPDELPVGAIIAGQTTLRLYSGDALIVPFSSTAFEPA